MKLKKCIGNILVNIIDGEYKCFLNDYGCAEYTHSKNLIKVGQLKKGVAGFTLKYAGKNNNCLRFQCC